MIFPPPPFALIARNSEYNGKCWVYTHSRNCPLPLSTRADIWYSCHSRPECNFFAEFKNNPEECKKYCFGLRLYRISQCINLHSVCNFTLFTWLKMRECKKIYKYQVWYIIQNVIFLTKWQSWMETMLNRVKHISKAAIRSNEDVPKETCCKRICIW